MDTGNKFEEINGQVENLGCGGSHAKKSSYLQDRMMIPKPFNHVVRRNSKEEVTKCFDDEHEGMKWVMDHIATFSYGVTEAVM